MEEIVLCKGCENIILLLFFFLGWEYYPSLYYMIRKYQYHRKRSDTGIILVRCSGSLT